MNVAYYVTGLLQPGATVAQANAALAAATPGYLASEEKTPREGAG